MPRQTIKKGEIGYSGYCIGNIAVFKEKVAPRRTNVLTRRADFEMQNLQIALERAEKEIQHLISRLSVEKVRNRDQINAIEVLESHVLTLHDPLFLEECKATIESGRDAYNAVKTVTNRYIRQFQSMTDARFKSKVSDVKDLQARLLSLLGFTSGLALPDKTDIIWAKSLRQTKTASLPYLTPSTGAWCFTPKKVRVKTMSKRLSAMKSDSVAWQNFQKKQEPAAIQRLKF